jgi:poly-gamma-glutamate capsule biosynthesis protein CapA/YwtB (metallophosphatase superfamily)
VLLTRQGAKSNRSQAGWRSVIDLPVSSAAASISAFDRTWLLQTIVWTIASAQVTLWLHLHASCVPASLVAAVLSHRTAGSFGDLCNPAASERPPGRALTPICMPLRPRSGVFRIAPIAVAASMAASAGSRQSAQGRTKPESGTLALFLSGDVMTGRGIDQVQASSCSPELYESSMKDARGYVRLAEGANGTIDSPVSAAYIWGDLLPALAQVTPDARIINLETAVTTNATPWPGKGVNYRMHPDNVGCITAASTDCCVLANNHVLDWGRPGLDETLQTLQRAGLHTAGAGADAAAAQAPAILDVADGCRVLVYAYAMESSGTPAAWTAQPGRSGVSFLPDLSDATVDGIAVHVRSTRRRGDIVIISLHWGSNWGYGVKAQQQHFAHALVDEGAADIVHGHSSHHPRPIEVYKDRLILYGAGDLINGALLCLLTLLDHTLIARMIAIPSRVHMQV